MIRGCAVQKIHNTLITNAYGDVYEIGNGRAIATALKNDGGSHPLKAYWYLHLPHAATMRNSISCPQSVYASRIILTRNNDYFPTQQ